MYRLKIFDPVPPPHRGELRVGVRAEQWNITDIIEILVEITLDKWRQLMWVMSKVEAKFIIAVFSISSCSKVNFLLANDKALATFYSSQKEIYFWAIGNWKNPLFKFCLNLATSPISTASTCPRLSPLKFR